MKSRWIGAGADDEVLIDDSEQAKSYREKYRMRELGVGRRGWAFEENRGARAIVAAVANL